MSSNPPIFRTIEVGHDQHITLGQALTPDVRALMTPPDPSARNLQMRTGTFGRAASIAVDLTDTLLVQQIQFTYDSNEPPYETLLQEYTDMLGPPHDSGTLADAQQSAVWADASTRFTLWERGTNLGSVLLDLQG